MCTSGRNISRCPVRRCGEQLHVRCLDQVEGGRDKAPLVDFPFRAEAVGEDPAERGDLLVQSRTSSGFEYPGEQLARGDRVGRHYPR